ncbi:hypothetical protein CYMTET_2691 [Cymbomonas tetramitiformis]|uniref:Uncharacterized protein n=1 Tax=Cymbomonas tetramitiformis TaxID=36881 RepID=A0AAE0H6I5_9CHLO|nr:hypothetical protein CYMTET_47141 [Cymbomonas tetramitiformis]KAK3285710.1 hypothetical protein CYMTET_6691 [Cymbomonas tetramitiformis]KAK3289896.1 hypothetical protein CYMTET_2691 [Cymbomonas tetramitiformis]
MRGTAESTAGLVHEGVLVVPGDQIHSSSGADADGKTCSRPPQIRASLEDGGDDGDDGAFGIAVGGRGGFEGHRLDGSGGGEVVTTAGGRGGFDGQRLRAGGGKGGPFRPRVQNTSSG